MKWHESLGLTAQLLLVVAIILVVVVGLVYLGNEISWIIPIVGYFLGMWAYVHFIKGDE